MVTVLQIRACAGICTIPVSHKCHIGHIFLVSCSILPTGWPLRSQCPHSLSRCVTQSVGSGHRYSVLKVYRVSCTASVSTKFICGGCAVCFADSLGANRCTGDKFVPVCFPYVVVSTNKRRITNSRDTITIFRDAKFTAIGKNTPRFSGCATITGIIRATHHNRAPITFRRMHTDVFIITARIRLFKMQCTADRSTCQFQVCRVSFAFDIIPQCLYGTPMISSRSSSATGILGNVVVIVLRVGCAFGELVDHFV